MRPHPYALLFLCVAVLLAAGCGRSPQPTLIVPSASPSAQLPSATSLPPPTATASPSPTPEPTNTPRPTATARPTKNPTQTPQASPGALYLQARLPVQSASDSGPADLVVITAPIIQGLTQQAGPDGQVEYLDARGQVVLRVGARHLVTGNRDDEYLDDLLFSIYGNDAGYFRGETYPIFYFPVEGIHSGFYAVDRNLSLSQINQMKEALELFSREEFLPFRNTFFDKKTAYLIYESLPEDIIGTNIIGTRIVTLDRQSLFGNKYFLAETIAHEGAHIHQKGQIFICQDLLVREVGDQTIPPGFEDWTAEQVLAGIENLKIGAYHLSYWTLTQLGISQAPLLLPVIRSATINGHELINCG